MEAKSCGEQGGSTCAETCGPLLDVQGQLNAVYVFLDDMRSRETRIEAALATLPQNETMADLRDALRMRNAVLRRAERMRWGLGGVAVGSLIAYGRDMLVALHVLP